MNKAMLTVGIIILSLATLLMINIISNYSSGSELDYYLVKETSEAAMIDAIDVGYYRENGLLDLLILLIILEIIRFRFMI